MKTVLHVTNYDFSMVLRVCLLSFHFIGHHKLSKSYNFSFLVAGATLQMLMSVRSSVRSFVRPSITHCSWTLGGARNLKIGI